MANSKDSIKKYTPPVETIVHDMGEIPEEITEEILKTLSECEDLADNKPKKRMSGLAGLFSRLKR